MFDRIIFKPFWIEIFWEGKVKKVDVRGIIKGLWYLLFEYIEEESRVKQIRKNDYETRFRLFNTCINFEINPNFDEIQMTGILN